MCRAVKVLCVAPDQTTLKALKAAAVSVEWELAAGAVGEDEALAQIDAERPHVLIAFGAFGRLVALARERFPGMHIVADRDLPGATAVATSMEEVRGLVSQGPRPGGPIRSA
jgi:hypothetical protein